MEELELKYGAFWVYIPSAESLNILSSIHSKEVITLNFPLWRRITVTGWDLGLLSVSKWSQNDYHFFSHGLWFVGCSPLVSLPSLLGYLLLNFRPQLKYSFLKKAFSDSTVKPDSLQHILIKFPSFIIVPTDYHYVLDERFSSRRHLSMLGDTFYYHNCRGWCKFHEQVMDNTKYPTMHRL